MQSSVLGLRPRDTFEQLFKLLSTIVTCWKGTWQDKQSWGFLESIGDNVTEPGWTNQGVVLRDLLSLSR